MMQDRPALTNCRLAADVAGYSRLMHADEEGTHTRLTSLLADLVYPAIAEHGGRIVKCTGDGFLAEFASAVVAIRNFSLCHGHNPSPSLNVVIPVDLSGTIGQSYYHC